MTDAEQVLWSRLRRKQVHGVQFYRQKPLENYIVDFYAPSATLVVELDGSQHFEPEHMQRDGVRDSCLRGLGLQVLRFDNLQVLRELDAVLGEIARVVGERVGQKQDQKRNPPQPPFCKGGSGSSNEQAQAAECAQPLFFKGGSETASADIPLVPKEESEKIPPFENERSEVSSLRPKGGLGGIYSFSDSPQIPEKTGGEK